MVNDLESKTLDSGDGSRVIRQEPDPSQTEVGEDLRADPIFTHRGRGSSQHALAVPRQATFAVRSDQVEEHAAALIGDELERRRHLERTVAGTYSEYVPNDALGMDANENIVRLRHVPLDECYMLCAGNPVAKANCSELAVAGRQSHSRQPLDEILILPPQSDYIADRYNRVSAAAGVRQKRRSAGDGTVVVHHERHRRGRYTASQTG
jgi:hypothetical protein